MLAQALSNFLNSLLFQRNLSPLSMKAYQSDLQIFLDFLPQDDTFCLENLHDFLDLMTQWAKPTTIARYVAALRGFAKFLFEQNLLPVDYSLLIKSPKISRTIPEPLSVEQVNALCYQASLHPNDALRNQAIVETLYGSGLRVSELVNLSLADISFSQAWIRVIGKGNRQRIVPISKQALTLIERYVLTKRTTKDPTQQAVFLSRLGKPLSRIMIFHLIRDWALLAGIKQKVSPHTLRHTFATHLIEGGAHIRAIQLLLGHQSITTTEIYTHFDFAYLRDTLMLYHPLSKSK